MKNQIPKHTLKKHAYRGLTFEQVMGLEEPAVKRQLEIFDRPNGRVDVMTRGLSVVLSRDVIANVKNSALIALKTAFRHPRRQVWYINTFAGVDLLQHALDLARREHGLWEYVPNTEIGDPEPEPDARTVGEYRSISRQPNLHFFDIPMGQWDADALAKAIQSKPVLKREGDMILIEEDEEQIKEQRPVIIINAFDYCPLNRGGKWRMARELMQLMDSLDLSVLLFTQEVRQEFAAGIAGRGSVGLMCGRAEYVVHLLDPFENLIRARKAVKQRTMAEVHEAQMRASERLRDHIPPPDYSGATPLTEEEIALGEMFKASIPRSIPPPTLEFRERYDAKEERREERRDERRDERREERREENEKPKFS